MKRVVLSEGKNDVHLVSSFFEECGGTYEVEQFHGEEIQTELRSAESRAITNFVEPRNDSDVLVKSENNKNNLQRVFAALVNQLTNSSRHTAVCVVVDLDGGTLDGFLENLDERVRGRQAGKGTTLGTHDLTARNRDMLAARCPVLTRQERVTGEFDVIAFKQTLERLTDIDRGNDDRDVKNEKVERLLDEDHIFELLDSVLNDGDR